MIEIQTLQRYSKDVNPFVDLLIDTYETSSDVNGYPVKDLNSIEDFWKNVSSPLVHIVLKNNKFIGFFTNKVTHNKVSFDIFVFSRACPLSARSLTKAGLYRSLMLYLEDPQIHKLEFVTHHPSLATVIKQTVPNVKFHYTSNTHIFCEIINLGHKDIVKIKEHLDKVLSIPYDKNKYNILL